MDIRCQRGAHVVFPSAQLSTLMSTIDGTGMLNKSQKSGKHERLVSHNRDKRETGIAFTVEAFSKWMRQQMASEQNERSNKNTTSTTIGGGSTSEPGQNQFISFDPLLSNGP